MARKGECKYLDYDNNECILTGLQCIGKDACDDYDGEE